jgi:hypothetical protein
MTTTSGAARAVPLTSPHPIPSARPSRRAISFQETTVTNPSDIPAADNNDQSDWEAKRAAQDQLRAELQPLNKTALFDALATAGVTHVVVSFDGYGDSGQIENVEIKAGETVVAMPEATIEVAEAVWGQPEPNRTTISIADEIERLVYDLLTDTHCGWENNDGAYGDFTLDIAQRMITLDYNERYTAKTTPTHSEEEAMSHCYHHALSSVKKWGGGVEDYLPLHQWFDESKAITADFRHRALRHHAEGIFMLERFFGETVTISTGRVVPVRLIGEQHIVEDLGFIPSFADWVRCIRPEPWMGRAQPIHKLVDPFATKAAGGA